MKNAFFQTGRAQREVYVIPSNESADRSHVYRLLRTAAYVLVNANAKWQVQSDDLLQNLGLTQVLLMPQL